MLRQIVAEICGYIDGLEGLRVMQRMSVGRCVGEAEHWENLCQALNTLRVRLRDTRYTIYDIFQIFKKRHGERAL